MMSRRSKYLTYKYWTIGYRKRGTERLFNQSEITELRIINKRKLGIQADPFLMCANGKNYLFYEYTGAIRLKGCIKCISLDEPGAGARVVLREPFHLSYPQVFERNGQYYMMPESRQNHKVTLYRATEFPWKWEPCRDLLCEDAVDSTLYAEGEKQYLFTYQNRHVCAYECSADAEGVPLGCSLLAQGEVSKRTRPAGELLMEQGQLYRPAQLCENFYGEALLFYQIDRNQLMGTGNLVEKEAFRLSADHIHLKNLEVCGVHTYNATQDYEVVDLYGVQYGMIALIKKLIIIPQQCIYDLICRLKK